jgi:ADP-ribose pyrophosphatase YjhB (NUDIX family)/predicted DNA-binding WGR domain protein
MQIIVIGKKFIIYIRYGRIGEKGTAINKEFTSASSAISFFKTQFKTKTGNNWTDKDDFEKKTGKYFLSELQCADVSEKDTSSSNVCGASTIKKADEHAKVCPVCGHISYPRLSPAIIAAITKGDKLLLARNKNFAPGVYSVLAGFVEAGETLEECVKREIREEAGIEIKNIKYFGSQSWPFPNSYMLAFTAEHESGEIKIGEDEIADAGWFGADEIPKVPGSLSISRKLIDWFIEKYRK